MQNTYKIRAAKGWILLWHKGALDPAEDTLTCVCVRVYLQQFFCIDHVALPLLEAIQKVLVRQIILTAVIHSKDDIHLHENPHLISYSFLGVQAC